jgi:ATP-dependent protease ClpP protease subunit
MLTSIKRKRLSNEDKDPDEEDSENNIVKRIGNNIYFFADVNVSTVFKLIELLNSTTQAQIGMSDHVNLFIFSGGGDAYAGLMAMDHIENNPIPVHTIADGLVASAATFLLLAGKHRFANQNSYILIHQLSTTFLGKYCDLVDELENSKCLMKKIKTLYKKKTKIPLKLLEAMISKELIIDSTRAYTLGFVDGMFKKQCCNVDTL